MHSILANKFVRMDGNSYVYITRVISDIEFCGICISSPTLKVREKPFMKRHIKDVNPNPSLVIESINSIQYKPELNIGLEKFRLLDRANELKEYYVPNEERKENQKVHVTKVKIDKKSYNNKPIRQTNRMFASHA